MISIQINSWASHPSSLTSLPRSLLKVWLGYCVNLRATCFESQTVLQQPRCGSARFYRKTHPPYYHQSCYPLSGVQYFSVMSLVVHNCHGFHQTDRICSFKHPFVCQKTSCVTKNNLVYSPLPDVCCMYDPNTSHRTSAHVCPHQEVDPGGLSPHVRAFSSCLFDSLAISKASRGSLPDARLDQWTRDGWSWIVMFACLRIGTHTIAGRINGNFSAWR